MTNTNGYAGRILFVDLSAQQCETKAIDEQICRKFLGGYGLGAKILYEQMKPGVDPLSPENILGFVTGPLTGTGAISSSRFTVVAKSPLTGLWGDANCGGTFGPQLKRSGYDAIFFTGKARNPVYLFIDNGKIHIRSAQHLWGMDTCEAERAVKAETSTRAAVACIGQSGERLSRIACISNDMGRMAGRSGLGAVMGSKNLKAIVVTGKQPVNAADRNAVKRLNRSIGKAVSARPPLLMRWLTKAVMPLLPFLSRRRVSFPMPSAAVADIFTSYGTCGSTAASAAMQDSPIKNWKGTQKDFPMKTASKLSDDAVIALEKKKYGCQGCPVKCGGIMQQQNGPYALKEKSHKPEYETLSAFGSLCLNDNLESIILANDLCNRYGLDTISAGGAIAFAIECYEEGILTRDDVGMELAWGDPQAIIALLRLICERKDFGDVLADGVKMAAERIGKGSQRYAMHVGGQELPMHDPRRTPGYGATYVVDPTPARHTAGGTADGEMGLISRIIDAPKIKAHDYARKGKSHLPNANLRQIVNCAGLCYFPTLMMPEYPVFELLRAVTGWDLTHQEWLKTGERIQMLRYCFNLREGFTPSDFSLPERVRGVPPFSSGPLKDITLDEAAIRRSCLSAMGIDEISGRPSPQKLKELGLEELITLQADFSGYKA